MMRISETVSGEVAEKLTDQIETALDVIVKGIRTVMESNDRTNMETADEADCIDGVYTNETPEDTKCTCNACVWCTNAALASDPVHIKKDGSLVHIQSISQLNKFDIDLEQPFWRCTEAEEEGYVCSVDREYIEGGTWHDVNELDDEGEGIETVNMDSSYMICTKYGGIIYFCDNGQDVLDNAKKILGIPDTPLYNYTLEMVGNITELDPKFDAEVESFRQAYERNRERYESLAELTGVPPELLAVIHYRENTRDYLNGEFRVYLHNGQQLGNPTTIPPKGKDFDDFDEAAIDAINMKSSYISKYNLSPTSKDIVAMLCYAEVYNGLGYYNNGHVSPYIYSGTNIYSSGKYVDEPSGSRYLEDVVDEQIGAYLLLNSILY